MATEIFKLVGRITYEGQQKVEKGLQNLSSKIENAQQKLKSFGESAQNVGNKTKGIGEGFTKYVSAPLAAVGAAGILAANDVDKAMGKIQAATGLTKKESKELADEAVNLWKNAYAGSIEEAADSLATVRQNMQDVASAQEIPRLTEQALKLRDALGYEVGESTRAATALMKNFGIDGEKAFDLITVGAQKGGDFSGELIDTINEYSTYFGAAGFSAEQMFNTLIAGTEAGAWNLDKVGDAVKEFNIRAKDGSKSTAEGFAAIGFNAEDMGQKIANGGEEGQKAVNATIMALANMEDPVQRNKAGVALFGTQWEDLESDVISAMATTEDKLGNVEGATDRAGAAMQDNLGTRAAKAWRSLQTALIPVGKILMDMVEPAVSKLQTGIEKLSNWFGS